MAERHESSLNRRSRPPSTPPILKIKIGTTTYTILEQLSLPDRGRWKVRAAKPYPRGTLFTILDLPDSKQSLQLKESLYRLPENTWGLPRLVDWQRDRGRLLMVIPWCSGTDLQRYFDRVSMGKALPPSPWESVRRMRSLSHALGVLHRTCRVVHGDIKPANLILPKDPGSLFLIDYGSSWQLERSAKREVGDGVNPFYSAPEVFLESRQVDERADQFSAAVVLFRMLTLKFPYGGLGGKAGWPERRAKMEPSYTPPSQSLHPAYVLPKSIQRELDDVVSTALKFDPVQRFQTSRAFSDALDGLWYRLGQAKHSADNQPPTWWSKIFG